MMAETENDKLTNLELQDLEEQEGVEAAYKETKEQESNSIDLGVLFEEPISTSQDKKTAQEHEIEDKEVSI